MVASKNPLLRLKHIQEEIVAITAASSDVDLDRYRGDYILRRATERALLIVSEAVKALPKELLARYPDVAWEDIANLGDVLRHEYHMIDDDTVWEILTRDIPEFSSVIDRMIADLTT